MPGSANKEVTKNRCLRRNNKKERNVDPKFKVRLGLFFDGTLNNRENVATGAENAPFGGNFGSYNNDYSNVSRLESYWKKIKGYDHSGSIYVEGIGTFDNSGMVVGDDPQGMATGSGMTGVKTKVKSGITQGVEKIVSWTSKEDKDRIDVLHIDVFGFSRGAAAARHFTYQAKVKNTVESKLKKKGYEVVEVSVKFVGLFDTVASFGIVHKNDTAQLHLDAIENASFVLQLAAAEEHRKNFRLTNIASAKAGKEIFLPGVHSDVGGGYPDKVEEKDLQIMNIDTVWLTDKQKNALDRERNWLIDAGWYKKHDIKKVDLWNRLKASRKSIRNRYNRIPLKIMADFAKEHGVNFYFKRIATKSKIIKDLLPVYDTINTYIAGMGISKPEDWFHLNNDMMRNLRYKYLHFSAYYGSISNKPQFTDNDPIMGRRKRIIQDG